MKPSLTAIVAFLALCVSLPVTAENILETRKNFKTTIVTKIQQSEELSKPPAGHPYQLVKYHTELGKMAAYLAVPDLKPKEKRPAIIWITGGHPQGGADPSYIDGAYYKNNQTANMFLDQGVITMYPTFRGTFGNPGTREEFYGEVNDVLSALDFLRKHKHVDKNHIYLGGHSTGATLAMLTAAATNKFSATLALGPQDDVKNHGGGGRLFNIEDEREFALRAPINYLSSIKTSVYVVEGKNGAADSLKRMREASNNKQVKFWLIEGADHFDVIDPISNQFAKAIMSKYNDRSSSLNFSEKNAAKAYKALRQNMMRAQALQHLSRASANGIDINEENTLVHYFYSQYKESIDAIEEELTAAKFKSIDREILNNDEGESIILLTAERVQTPSDLTQLFNDQALFETIAERWVFDYKNWYIKE